jgi:hypothetical protein
MKRLGKVVLLGTVFLAGMGVGLVVLVPAQGEVSWACPPERMGVKQGTPADGGGADSRLGAVEASLAGVAEDGGLSQERLKEAVASNEGPDRYDAEQAVLFLDDKAFASFGFTRLSDETWAATQIQQCFRPPDSTKPGETPSSNAE